MREEQDKLSAHDPVARPIEIVIVTAPTTFVNQLSHAADYHGVN